MLIRNSRVVMYLYHITTYVHFFSFFYSAEEPEEVQILEKYTFSNAIATSVKLGMLEAKLDRLIDSIDFVTSDLKRGKIHMTQALCSILTST